MIKIFAYNNKSKSAHALAEALDCRLLRHENSRYVPRHGDTVINWGRGRIWNPARTLNLPQNVESAVDKRRAFVVMSENGVRTVPFTVELGHAQHWQDQGHTVMVRQIVTGKEGEGIHVIQPGTQIPRAPLYTRYVRKAAEYRVHIVNGQCIDIQQKVLPRSHNGDKNFFVRNTANGFIFIRGGVQAPEDVTRQATAGIQALRLDFGAVDVIWGGRNAYVLEINTAPGIEGQTIESYATAFRQIHA